MMKAKFLFLFLVIHSYTFGQPFHQDVFQGLVGDELFSKLNETYKPSATMSYGMARDTLYSKIDIGPDSTLEGIYSGFTITLDPLLDPTTDAFDKGINAEHSYPQSKGAGNGYGRSDLHHLYPSKIEVNSARQSYPLGEIPDSDTDYWYFDDIKVNTVPIDNIDQYSELDLDGANSRFEPRESVKGNLARGIFYFYTMYREEALNADPTFFNIQKGDLCNWHFLDPVDETEWNRTMMIGKYQENKPNPFVLDCSLASRLYCDQTSSACDVLTSTIEITFENDDFIQIYPNPVTGSSLNVNLSSDVAKTYLLRIHDFNLKVLDKTFINTTSKEINTVSFPAPSEKGVYFIIVQDERGATIAKKFVKI